MQCPKCRYEPTLTEVQKSPEICLKCGINYSEHEARKAALAQERKNAALGSGSQRSNEMRVVIVDFDMGFDSMVRLLVKLAFAIIPALLIIALVWTAILAVIGAFAR